MKKLSFVLPLCVASVLGAAEYFVSPSGNDSNPGSAKAPFATIGKAVKAVQPGDIVTIRSGVYRESINISQKGTAQKPIIFRGAPGETAVITGGYLVTTPWKKAPNRRFIWETETNLSVNMLWDKLNHDRFLELKSLDMVEKSPGSFMLDKKAKKLYVHPLQSVHPDTVGIVISPWLVNDKAMPVSFNSAKAYRWSKGISISGSYITIDNLYVTFFPGQGIRINKPGKFNTISNCTVLGTTCGIMDYATTDNKIINNRLLRNAGTGIQLTGVGARCLIENNFMYNNGHCFQSGIQGDGSSGQIYNFAQYGGFDRVTMRHNVLVAYERRNGSGNTMRCKGGVRRFLELSNNVFVNGGIELYARTKSSANVSSNTMINGKFNIHKGLKTGEAYVVRQEKNLLIKSGKNASGFADEAYFDYRLRKGSAHAGTGAHPEAGKGFCHVSSTAALNAALVRQDIDTIYLTEGTYSGNIATKGNKIVLRNAGKKKVVLANAVISGKGAAFEGLIFKNSTIKISDKACFNTCVLDKTTLNGGKIMLKKGTLLAVNANCKKLTLSETLLVGNDNKISAGEKLEENCGTIASVDSDYRLPSGHKFAYSAFDNGAIGGRPAEKFVKDFMIEEVEVIPLPPDKARVFCRTPNAYWSKANVSGNGFFRTVYQSPTGLKNTAVDIVLHKLVPGKSYKGTLTVWKRGKSGVKTSRKFSFKMPDRAVPSKKVHTVNAKNPLDKVLKKLLPGETVIVEPGVYHGGFVISVDNVTIKSKVPGKAVLSAACLYRSILHLDRVKNVTVEGFRFGNTTYSASNNSLEVSECKNIKVRYCYFDTNSVGGCSNNQLRGGGIDGILVQDCVFTSGFQAIWLLRAKNVVIDHNTFWGTGINSAHIGCEQGDKVTFTNNISVDVVGGHHSPVFSVAEHGKHITCDYNLYWHTDRSKKQEIYGVGRWKKTHYFSGTWDVMNKNMEKDINKVRSRFGIEKHGMFADPLFVDHKTFRLKNGSPAKGAAKDGSDLGAREVYL